MAQKSRVKVFMVIKRLRYSGAYKMFMWLANALCERGHDITIMTYMRNDVETLNSKMHWIKHDELENSSIIKKISVIRKEIKKSKADVSISFLLDANVYNIFACLGLGTKSIVCERNDPFKPGYRKLQFWKPWFRFANGAVYQLPKVAEYYSNIKAPTAVIPNPVLCHNDIDIAPFENRPDTINILGRLDIFQKRHDVLIEAFSKFVEWYSSFKLVFYGDGPDKEKMQNQVSKLCLEGKVIFAGITNTPFEVMKNSKMYVLTSDFEGIPNSLIEAMSLGLPCISTDCRPGGARLLINDGINGFIVPQGDSNAIAEKMKWYMQHSVEADKMGLEGTKIKNTFSEEVIISQWENYLSELKNK